MYRIVQPLMIALCALIVAVNFVGAAETDIELPAEIAKPGHALLLRHALAPGIGDPENLDLSDCKTQRNLSEEGKVQAYAIGKALKKARVRVARVYSSQWCRAKETAALIDFGPSNDLWSLNSFFSFPKSKEFNMKSLRQFLEGQNTTGPLLVLVTHQVNIAELTGLSTGSGEGVLFKLPLTEKTTFKPVQFPKTIEVEPR